MIPYYHWDIEYQGGERAISDAIIAESVKRIRKSTQQIINDQHIQIIIPDKYKKGKLFEETYIIGYIDGFSALVAQFN